MLNVLKHSGRISRVFNVLEVKNSQFVTAAFRPYTYLVGCSEKRSCGATPGASFLACKDSSLILSRNKHANKKTKHRKQMEEEGSNDEEEDSSDEEEEDDSEDAKSGFSTLRVVNSRIDLILKKCLNFPRNKIKENFYEDRIRVNGRRVPKLAHLAVVGDEIDLIHEYKPESNSLIISQVKFSKANIDMDTGVLVIKTKVFKNVPIKNYSNENAFKGSSQGN